MKIDGFTDGTRKAAVQILANRGEPGYAPQLSPLDQAIQKAIHETLTEYPTAPGRRNALLRLTCSGAYWATRSLPDALSYQKVCAMVQDKLQGKPGTLDK